LVHMKSFIAVTGPKLDIWLVQTVAVLILAIGVFILLQLKYHSPIIPVAIMAIIMSAGLAIIDFYYASIDRISDVYALDGILQVAFTVAWLYVLGFYHKIEERLPVPKNSR
jgi:TRAP-type uncharacterized transport system fused permease subunit